MSLEVSELSYRYDERKILNNISLYLQFGEITCLIGPNGVGKTTLMRCMLRLLTNYVGQIRIEGKDTKEFSPKKLAQKMAYIPQLHTPVFNTSILDMTMMGTIASLPGFASPKEKQKKVALNALEKMGLLHLRDRGFMQTSGGERQLTLIARALAQQAKILIMDEPTANLDYGNRFRVLEQVKELAKEGYCIVMTTHHIDEVLLYAHRAVALCEGSKIADGRPKEVVDASLIQRLYDAEVEMIDVRDGEVRFCIPKKVEGK